LTKDYAYNDETGEATITEQATWDGGSKYSAGSWQTIATYDEQGRYTKVTRYEWDRENGYDEIDRDDYDSDAEYEQAKQDNATKWYERTNYSYNDDGQVESYKESGYNKDLGNYSCTVNFTYDDKGRVKAKTKSGESEYYSWYTEKTTYYYDDETGRRTKAEIEAAWSGKGSTRAGHYYKEYTYDEYGRETSYYEEGTNKDGKRYWKYRYHYEYDENGNVTGYEEFGWKDKNGNGKEDSGEYYHNDTRKDSTGNDQTTAQSALPGEAPSVKDIIASFYRDILGRDYNAGEVSDAELQNWVNAYNGGMSLEEIKRRFIDPDSPDAQEFLNTVKSKIAEQGIEEAIKYLYKAILGRDADAEGLKNWVDAYNNGKSIEDIIRDFLNSAEYQNGAKTEPTKIVGILEIDGKTYFVDANHNIYDADLNRIGWADSRTGVIYGIDEEGNIDKTKIIGTYTVDAFTSETTARGTINGIEWTRREFPNR
jgi:hypothetical protein